MIQQAFRTSFLHFARILAIFFLAVFALHAQFRYDVKMGIDNLSDTKFRLLSQKKIALVTNHTGRSRALETTAELFAKNDSCKLTAILTPEHGFYGTARAGETVADGDSLFGVPVHSLYGKHRRPTREMLASANAVVFDVQDIGIRSYTFLSTLFTVMDACAEFGKPLYVLDRPNPLGGLIVDGNVPDSGMTSFVGIIPVPYLHGCTFGELARMINGEGWLPNDADGSPRQCDLTVVRLKRWERWMTWEDTDFTWVPTSPHIPTVNAIRGAAMTGIWGELSIVNIGVGYTLPFQCIGTPEIRSELLTEALKRHQSPGVTVVPMKYRPFYGKFANTDCNGAMIGFTPDPKLRPYSAGIEMMLALRNSHPRFFADSLIAENNRKMFEKTSGSKALFPAFFQGGSEDDIRQISTKGVQEFLQIRRKYLMYE